MTTVYEINVTEGPTYVVDGSLTGLVYELTGVTTIGPQGPKGDKGDTGDTGPEGGAPFLTTVGDGVTTDFVVTHSLGTRDIGVIVYLASGTYAEVEPDVEHTTIDTVTLRFDSAPTADQFNVVIWDRATTGPKGDKGDTGPINTTVYGDVDGGLPDSIYGGVTPINGGTP